MQLKFELSEKRTKFEKIFLMVLTDELIYLVKVKTTRKIFSNYVCFSKSPNFKYNTPKFSKLFFVLCKLTKSYFRQKTNEFMCKSISRVLQTI